MLPRSEASLERPGLNIAFSAVSETSWTHPEAMLVPLGRVLGRLTAVLERLRAVLGRLWALVASQKPPNERQPKH